MDTETLFTATKWEILKLLETQPRAPSEIATILNSSLGNVSQQLKLLELAGVVTTDRISNREKGQPRTLYRLTGDLSYMISTAGSFVDKKVVQLSERNKVVLRIWFLEDSSVRYALEKAFWQLDGSMKDVTRITYAGLELGIPTLEVASSKKLPTSLKVGGSYGNVNIKTVDEPVGYVLYQGA